MNIDEFKTKAEEFEKLVRSINYTEMKAADLQPYLNCGNRISESFKDIACMWTTLNEKFYQELINYFEGYDGDGEEVKSVSQEAIERTGIEITEDFDPYDSIWEVLHTGEAIWGYRSDTYDNGVQLQWEGGWATSYC